MLTKPCCKLVDPYVTVFMVVTMSVLLYMTTLGIQQFRKDYAIYQLENLCIADKVRLGIHRSNIVRDNGKCYVME